MQKSVLVIPESHIEELLPKMIYSFLAGIENAEGNVFPKEWLDDEIRLFKKTYKKKLSHGKYKMTLKEIHNFCHTAFETLVDREVFEMVKSGAVEMGVGENGEMTFWKK